MKKLKLLLFVVAFSATSAFASNSKYESVFEEKVSYAPLCDATATVSKTVSGFGCLEQWLVVTATHTETCINCETCEIAVTCATNSATAMCDMDILSAFDCPADGPEE